MRELVTVLLGNLGLKSVVVHQEAVATAFGSAISTACVVNVGAQVLPFRFALTVKNTVQIALQYR